MSFNEVAIATTSRKWSEIVAKGQTMKVPTTSFRKNHDQQDRQATESIIIFERDDLAAQMKLHRAEMILQQALNPDTVLFEFPGSADLGNEGAIYKMIEKQLGLAIGFRTVSHPNKNRRGNIIIEAKLTEDAHAKALTEGLTVQGVKYLGTPTKSTEEDYPDMVKVHVSGVPLALPEEVKEGLLESLEIYGKVCQIRMEKRWGYFEGNATILLDRKEKGETFEPLQRMLFLRAWERYAPAHFKGAPPVCFHCRQSDHMKKDCPVLAQIKCFECRGKGHIARNCHLTRKYESDSDDQEEEKPDQKKRKTILVEEDNLGVMEPPQEDSETENEAGGDTSASTTGLDSEDSVNQSTGDNKVVDISTGDKEMNIPEEDKDMDIPEEDKETVEEMECTATGRLALAPQDSLQASQHAPGNSGRKMSVDSQREMLALSTAKTPRRTAIIAKKASQLPQPYDGQQEDTVVLHTVSSKKSAIPKSPPKKGTTSKPQL